MFGSPKRSALLSGLIHAAAIVLIVAATRMSPPPAAPQSTVSYVTIDVGRYLPPVRSTGGGGGGAGDLTRASRGRLPRLAARQFTPPAVVVTNLHPVLAIEPTLVAPPDIALPAIPLPNYGDPNGVSGPLSGGRGTNGGIGDGRDGGVGDRRGPGYGNDGDYGGVSGAGGSIHGTITPPILLVKIEPEYSDDARRAKLQGTVLLSIEVDTRGEVHNISVKQSLGLGLDEKAMEAVSRWKFRPGTIDGKPAVIAALVEVNFRLL